MKKTILLLSFLITFSFVQSQCHYVVDMQDSYGDGWNGAAINVSINGVPMTSFTVPTGGTSAIDSISTYTGDNISFDFVSGTWDTEITFTITAPDGSSVGSFGPYVNNTGNSGSIWSGVSNSTCAPPACLDPYGLAASSITSDSLDISWSAGPNGAAFNIEYGPTGFTLGSGSTSASSATTATITGLSGYTEYDFYVQADCQTSGNGTSNFAGPLTVTTCPGAAPYLETLDGGFAACWSQDQNDQFDWTLNTGPTTSLTTGPTDDMTGGGNYLYIETSTPRIPGDTAILYTYDVDISTLSVPQLRFYSHMYGASIGTLLVDISDNGGTSYTNVFTKSGDQGDQWNEETVNLSSYTGSVSFRITANVSDDGNGTQFWGDIAIDNFELRDAPSCPKPTNVIVSNINSSSADFTWTPGGTETSWNVEYGLDGFSLGAGASAAVSATSYSATGLTSQTDYDFYVQANCGVGDSSYWQGPVSFTTTPACGDTFGPYCYDAGAYTVFTAIVSNPGDMIKLDIIAGETEVGYDSLQIYDGVGNTGALLYSADGDHTGGMAISTSGTISLYVNGDGTWNCVDGVGGPYVPIEALITCITPSPVDMEMTALTMASTFGPGNNDITGTVTSYGTNNVSSIDVVWDDGSGPNNETISVNLNFGDTYDFTHGTSLIASGGQTYSLDVEVNATGDANTNNNSLSGTYNSVTEILPKVVVGEEKTGEWCGWCPRGAVGLVDMAFNYPNDFIGIAVHNGDGMVVTDYDGNIGNYIPGGYPGGGVDRVIDGDPSDFVNMMNQRKTMIPPVGVTATGSYDANTITVNINAQFVAGMSGDLRLAAVLVGDSISGAGQVNYYDGGGAGPLAMPNYGSMPNLDFTTAGDPIFPFYHDHVALALGDDEINGASGSVAASVSPGDSASHTYTFPRNSSWNMTKVHVVGMLVNGATGEIYNADKGHLTSTSVGLNQADQNLSLNFFPNPSNGISSLVYNLNKPSPVIIKVFNVLGEEIYNYNNNVIQHVGIHSHNIDLSKHADGVYYVKINVNNTTQTIKVSLKR